MELSKEERIAEAWDAFADAGFTYVSESGERRSRTEVRDERHDQLVIRQDVLDDFLEERTDLTTFKNRMNEESASNKLWGFSGFSGMMFFHNLESAAAVDDGTDLSTILREVLASPSDQDTARSRLQQFVEYVNRLRSTLDEGDSAPAVGYVPYFVSYFWQLQEPDTYPIYYSSMRDALADLDIWTPSGEHPDDYIEFWKLNEEIRDVLESHTQQEIHLWDIERLCLFWLNRDAVSSPRVWVEKAKPTEWNYGDPGSGFAYGEALWAPQENDSGQQIYERLREPTSGDIVLHLSREDDAIVGTSVIASELQTDFEIPEDASWSAEQRDTGGYRRELTDYRELTPPFSVKTDLLEVERLEPSLSRIAENNSVFYTETLRFSPQAYVTEAPRELVERLALQNDPLRERLPELGYHLDGPTPISEHEYRAAWLRDRYDTARDWDRLASAAQQTSTAVRTLAQALVDEQDSIDTTDLTTLFRLCQHSSKVLVETKREGVRDLDISESAKEDVLAHVSEAIGSVGGINLNQQLPDQEAEQAAHELLAALLETDDPDEVDDIVAEFAALEITGLQSGSLSPIFHYLHPEYFPIINGLSVDGITKYFGASLSKSIDEYLEHSETFRQIRDQYDFNSHCRDLDYFFVWADQLDDHWDHDWTWHLTDEGNSTRDVYAIQPGSSEASEEDREYLWPAWQEHDIISVGGEDGDLRTLSEAERKRAGDTHGWGATEAWETLIDMSPGDIVVAKYGTRKLVGIGVVKPESYSYAVDGPGYQAKDDGKTTRHPHIREVEWIIVDPDGWHVSEIGLDTEFARDTAYSYGYFEELRYKIAQLIENGVSHFQALEETSRDYSGQPATEFTQTSTEGPNPQTILSTENLQGWNIPHDALLDGLYFPDEDQLVNRIRAALQAGKHIIFTGPPGTGKTEIAENVCQALLGLDSSPFTDYKLTTATADWSTFDTVGGRMPADKGDSLVFSPGFVLQRFKQENRQQNDLLIIDELNRADIDKAFGQLFTLLSGQAIQLPFQKRGHAVEVIPAARFRGTSPEPHEFVMPSTWRLVATMNSYDKASLYEMSYAFMRRFAFIDIDLPDLEAANAGVEPIEFLTPYLTIWFEFDSDQIDEGTLAANSNAPNPEDVRAVVAVWEELTTGDAVRPVGPALIEDMLSYMTNHDGESTTRLVDALIAYVFPQLEGVPDRSDIVSNLAALDQVTGEATRLRSTAKTMLNASFDDDSTST